MTIDDYVSKKLDKGTVHITLIDPLLQVSEVAARLAYTAQEVGSDLIFVAGSKGVTQRSLVETTAAIKQKVKIPVVYFPSGSEALGFGFDAILFLSMINSRNPYFITGAHTKASFLLKKMDMEVIPVGYIVIEPGMKTGEIGEAELVPRDNRWRAIDYALTAEYMGMRYVFLEAGNGASQPIPANMIRAVKREIRVPLIVGGGVRTAIDARRMRQAGADIVVTGTIIENAGYRERLRSILSALKE